MVLLVKSRNLKGVGQKRLAISRVRLWVNLTFPLVSFCILSLFTISIYEFYNPKLFPKMSSVNLFEKPSLVTGPSRTLGEATGHPVTPEGSGPQARGGTIAQNG